jgi:hypothetical protein
VWARGSRIASRLDGRCRYWRWTSSHSSHDCHIRIFSVTSSSLNWRSRQFPSLLLLALFPNSRVIVSSIYVPRSSERRFYDPWRSFVRQSKLNKAVEVVEDLGVAEDRGAPVCIDTPLQLSVRF